VETIVVALGTNLFCAPLFFSSLLCLALAGLHPYIALLVEQSVVH
jgi:hypothetical protein